MAVILNKIVPCTRRPLTVILTGVLSLLAQTQVQAESRLLTPYVDMNYTWYSNLRQIPDDIVMPEDFKYSDSALRAVAGLALEKEFGRQRLNLRGGLVKAKYANNKQADYDARDVQGSVAWMVGSHLTGNLGFSRSSSLTPFVEFHDAERNLRTERNRFADAAWRFHPSWRLRGTVSQYDLTHEMRFSKFGDRERRTSEMWFDYISASGSTIGLMVRHQDEKFPFGQILSNRLVNNDRRLDEMKLRVDWKFSGKTQVQLLAGLARMRQVEGKERDYSGLNARATVNWYPTGKLELTGILWHEISAVDNLTTNYAINDGVRIAPAWNISSKMRLEGLFRYEKRKPVAIAGLATDQLDRVMTSSLTFTYVPLPRLQLVTSVTRDTLNSNLVNRSYHANSMSFNAHYEY